MDERYVVMPGERERVAGTVTLTQPTWTVSDRQEMKHLCVCTDQRNAVLIASCLNQAELES